MRGVEIRPSLRNRGSSLVDVRAQDAQLLVCSSESGLGRRDGSARSLVDGSRSLRILLRAGSRLSEQPVALGVDLRESGLRDLGVHVGAGLFDRRLLQHVFNAQACERRLALLEYRFGVIGGGARITIVEANQQLAGFDLLIVGYQDLRNEPRNVRRYRCDVAADIGVVGALEVAADRPPVITVAAACDSGYADQADDAQLLEANAWRCLQRRALLRLTQRL